MNHTKTPWKYNEGRETIEAEGRDIAYLNPTDSDANAEFITRACNAHEELLEAVEALVDCQREKDPTAFNMRYDKACQQARKAIAHAEGGSK